MPAPALPTGFWLCLGGLVLAAGVSLLCLAALLRRVRFSRAKAILRDEGATTIVEFPFVMILLVQITALTWQLGFLVSSYLVVDYAAFAAARCAIVLIPPKTSDDEPANTVKNVTLEGSDKGEEIEEAAALVCYPISARYTEDNAWQGQIPFFDDVVSIPGGDAIKAALEPFDFATRYVYALRNTHARLLVPGKEAGEHAFGPGHSVTVEVTHDFSLRVPFASRILGEPQLPEGYVTPIRASATLLFEGGNEKVPKGAPEGAQP